MCYRWKTTENNKNPVKTVCSVPSMISRMSVYGTVSVMQFIVIFIIHCDRLIGDNNNKEDDDHQINGTQNLRFFLEYRLTQLFFK